MKRIFITMIWFFILLGCGNDCRQYENIFKEKEFNFKVEKKYKESKYKIISGYNNASYETFKEIGFLDFYDMVEIGDSVIKGKGCSDINIIRNGNKKIYKYWCH